jgi:tetratricopeptide (TPR) repeat protein
MKAGDNEGARQAFEECDRTIPTAIDCVYEEARLAQGTGRCADMEKHSHTLTRRLPSGNRGGYELLARALAANDVGRESVAEALRQAASDATPERAALAKLEQARLAIAYGDFDHALAMLADVDKAIDASDHLGHHVTTTQLAFELNLELERPEAALAIAQTFDHRQRAWSGAVTEFYGSGEEGFLVIPRMLGLQLAQGKITAERRDAELASWIARRETIGDPRVRWIARYAASAQTTKDAEEAVAVMPRDDASGAALAPILGLPSALIGRVLARGGRPEEGIQELRAFTRRCERLDNPIAQPQAFLWLGEALESTGNTAEACAAYAVVRSRWSDRRSVSARRAEERLKALACAARDR